MRCCGGRLAARQLGQSDAEPSSLNSAGVQTALPLVSNSISADSFPRPGWPCDRRAQNVSSRRGLVASPCRPDRARTEAAKSANVRLLQVAAPSRTVPARPPSEAWSSLEPWRSGRDAALDREIRSGPCHELDRLPACYFVCERNLVAPIRAHVAMCLVVLTVKWVARTNLLPVALEGLRKAGLPAE
jgi:hypothetical protein